MPNIPRKWNIWDLEDREIKLPGIKERIQFAFSRVRVGEIRGHVGRFQGLETYIYGYSSLNVKARNLEQERFQSWR
jgi:hypothetical protein